MEEKQPKEYDAVLGGQNSAPSDGVVLGGIEGAKQRLLNGDENYRSGGKYYDDSPLMVWDCATGKHLAELSEWGRCAAISPDGQTIASYSECTFIQILRVP
ncbi:MAG: hypothetical protein AAFQ91_09900 [Cyanobacteria bacterium J06621_15]